MIASFSQKKKMIASYFNKYVGSV